MEGPWTEDYTAREWTTYTLKPASPSFMWLDHILDRHDFLVCRSGCEACRDEWERTGATEGVLFYDVEQRAMGLEKVYGIALVGVLADWWFCHPPGSLVMAVFSGFSQASVDPAKRSCTYTVGVADSG